MPTFKKTHEEMRSWVCGVCWLKPKKLQNITQRLIIQIKDFVNPEYSLDDDDNWLPTVICDTCHRSIRKNVYLTRFSFLIYFLYLITYQVDCADHEVKHIDFSTLTPPKRSNTRGSLLNDCTCSVCMTGQLSRKDYQKYKVENSCPVGCPKKENVEPPPTDLVVCNICFCHYRKGLPHKCSQTSQIENATNLCKYYYIDYRTMLPLMPFKPDVRGTSVFT